MGDLPAATHNDFNRGAGAILRRFHFIAIMDKELWISINANNLYTGILLAMRNSNLADKLEERVRKAIEEVYDLGYGHGSRDKEYELNPFKR